MTASDRARQPRAPDGAEQTIETLAAFAAEMSGLISDMDDVPDPGLGDLPGMAETIRREYELAVGRLDERAERLAEAEKARVAAIGFIDDAIYSLAVGEGKVPHPGNATAQLRLAREALARIGAE